MLGCRGTRRHTSWHPWPLRAAIHRLAGLGPLPASNDTDANQLSNYQQLLESLQPPVSDAEAAVLAGLFPPHRDGCFGLAWTLVHLLELPPAGRCPGICNARRAGSGISASVPSKEETGTRRRPTQTRANPPRYEQPLLSPPLTRSGDPGLVLGRDRVG